MKGKTRFVAALALVGAASGCSYPTITAVPGPTYADANGNVRVGVAVAGKDAGGPCLLGPACLVPTQ